MVPSLESEHALAPIKGCLEPDRCLALAWIVKFGLILFVIPFLILPYFVHPLHDDYCQADVAKHFGLLHGVMYRYHTWSGRYFSMFMGLAIAHFINFFVSVKIMSFLFIATFGLSIYSVARVGKHLWISDKDIFWVTLIAFDIYVSQLPSLCEGFYWLPPAYSYQLSATLCLFLVALLIWDKSLLSFPARIMLMCLSCLLTIAVTGSTETNAAVLLAFAFGGTVFAARSDQMSFVQWALVLVICGICCAIVILAPGNSIRAHIYPGGRQILTAILSSLVYGSYFIVRSATGSVSLIVSSILMIPMCVSAAGRSDFLRSIQPRQYLIATGFWFFLIYGTFFPVVYSMGGEVPTHVQNFAYFVFLTGWFPHLFLLVALYKKKWGYPVDSTTYYL